MSASKFLISSLVAAGFGHDGDGVKLSLTPLPTDRDPATAPRLFTQDHYFTLAGHSSHASHASHSSGGYSGGHYSHTSHRSSSGGYDYSPPVYVPPAPTPLYRSTPAPTPPPNPLPAPSRSLPAVDLGRASPPPPDGLPALSGRTKRFEAIVKRVQIALMAQGYYKGPIDGVVSPTLRGAIRKFQGDRSLAVTGTITPPTLDALQIAAQ